MSYFAWFLKAYMGIALIVSVVVAISTFVTTERGEIGIIECVMLGAMWGIVWPALLAAVIAFR